MAVENEKWLLEGGGWFTHKNDQDALLEEYKLLDTLENESHDESLGQGDNTDVLNHMRCIILVPKESNNIEEIVVDGVVAKDNTEGCLGHDSFINSPNTSLHYISFSLGLNWGML